MDQAFGYFDDWLKKQREWIAAWADGLKKVQEAYLSAWPGTEASRAVFEQYLDLYRSWLPAAPGPLKPGCEKVGGGVAARAAQGRNVYETLYEMWTPLWQAVQEKAVDTSALQALVDPSKFKELMDRVFGFNPEAIREFYDQAQMNIDTAADASRKFVGPCLTAFEKNIEVAPSLLQGHPESMLKIFHNNYSALDCTLGRMLHIPPVGKDREKIELFLKGFDDLAVYMEKYFEYQHVMYFMGLRAFERLIQEVARRIREDDIKSFNDIFELWVDMNEKEYLALGRTEEFAKLQGELMNAGLSVRRHYFKLIELHLYDFPVALRSEMDDLYKTIYELKKKVKNLETKIKDFTGEEVAA